MAPWFITTMRSATDSASSWSCVTMMVVTPTFCCSARISCRSRTRSSASSADSGSSSSSRPGEVASARASAMRCCWPPDKLGRVPGFAARQADQLEQFGHARLGLRFRRAAIHQPIGHVVGHRQVGEQRVALEHDAVVALGRRQARDVARVLPHLAGALHLEAGDDAQQRRLAAARGAEEADELAAGDAQVDVLQRRESAEGLADVAQFEVAGVGVGRSSRPAGAVGAAAARASGAIGQRFSVLPS
jgi:hypothetical protein